MLKKSVSFTVISLCCPIYAAELPINVASPEHLQMHAFSGPPPIINPKVPMSTPIENQFDHKKPLPPSVTDVIDDSMLHPLHVALQNDGHSTQGNVLWRSRQGDHYSIVQTHITDAQDYRDGHGNRVNYGYKRDGENVILGWLPNAQSEYRFTFVRDRIKDDKQPQHQMDPVNTQRVVAKFDARWGAEDLSNTLTLSLRSRDVRRKADNFSLRPNKNGPKVFMEVERDFYDIGLNYHFNFNQLKNVVGVYYEYDLHNARRFMRTPKGDMRNAFRFADIRSDLWRVFAASNWQITLEQSLHFGLNFDHLSADPRAKNQGAKIGPQMLPAPNMLWQAYYGAKVDDDVTKSGLSARLRYQYALDEHKNVYLDAGSLLRMPDNVERFSSLPGPMGRAFVGNPFIKPERHNRVAVGFDFKGESYLDYQRTRVDDYRNSWQLQGELYYDFVDDFITLDRARGQSGVKQKDMGVVARNVDARLAGVVLSGAYNLDEHWSTGLRLDYQYGNNQTDSRPLYQVSPLTVDWALDFRDYASFGTWNVGANLHYVNKQTRLDNDKKKGYGVDLDESAKGYTLLDLYGGVQFNDRFGVQAGVNNVFDRQYAEFINGNHVIVSNPGTVYAPGRYFWLGFHFNF